MYLFSLTFNVMRITFQLLFFPLFPLRCRPILTPFLPSSVLLCLHSFVPSFLQVPLSDLALQSSNVLYLDHHTHVLVWSGRETIGPQYDGKPSPSLPFLSSLSLLSSLSFPPSFPFFPPFFLCSFFSLLFFSHVNAFVFYSCFSRFGCLHSY